VSLKNWHIQHESTANRKPVNYDLLVLAELAARCFTVTKRHAEKFNHDCSAFATITLLYRHEECLGMTVMTQL